MKKIIAVLLALVLLVVGGLGGIAYAQDNSHEPMTGEKLVGLGPCGIAPGMLFYTNFALTNPDCVSAIAIERLSVIGADGTVIYEGPPLIGMQGEELTTPLEPHQSVDIQLPYYVVGGSANPIDWPDAMIYTVEVFWTGTKSGLPLTGWTAIYTIAIDDAGNIVEGLSTASSSQMVNIDQKLKP